MCYAPLIIKNITKPSIILLALTLLSTSLYADPVLEKVKAEKKEIRHSMMGFRSTLIFYTFKDERAILTLLIDNKDETFPVTGKVYIFEDGVTEEGLKKWINNQHSDGLFVDPAKPVHVIELPKEVCTVTAHEKTGESENPSPVAPGMVNNFDVKLSVKEHTEDGKFKLSAFTDTAQVHVKGK